MMRSRSEATPEDDVPPAHPGTIRAWLFNADGRDDMTPGVGPYVWLSGEEWLYSDWEDGQPNAYETDCPVGQDDADCFEHCAFQSDEGDWLDRSCWHTIVSVCEWEVVKSEGGAAGAAGAAGAGGAASDP